MYKSAINILAFVTGFLFSISIASFAWAGDEACSFFDFPNESEALAQYVDYQLAVNNDVSTGSWVSVSTWDCADGSHFYAHYSSTSVWEYDHSNFAFECAGGGLISSTADRKRIITFGTTSTSCTSLPPDEPSTCNDGIISGDETGYDCGGSCLADCTPFCPSSSVTQDNGDGTYSCVESVSLDDYGNCPKDTSYVQGDTELGGDTPDACIKTTDPILGPVDYNPSFDDYTEPWDSGSYIIVENAYEPTVVDNGDGTSTETIVTERDLQDADGTSTGSSTTSTTTNVINNTTGAVISSVTTTSGTTDPTDDPSNYDWSMPDGFGDNLDGDLLGDLPEEKSIEGLYNSFIMNNPVTTLFENTEITTADSVCSLSWNYKGTDIEFSLCGDPYESTFKYMGNILFFISTITGYFIIFGRR